MFIRIYECNAYRNAILFRKINEIGYSQYCFVQLTIINLVKIIH